MIFIVIYYKLVAYELKYNQKIPNKFRHFPTSMQHCLIIDFDDKITINLKDEGKTEVMENIKKSFSDENIKVSEVLGLNNIEYIINMR